MFKLLKYYFFINLFLFIISFINRDRLPNPDEILEELFDNPGQSEIYKEEFEITAGEMTYTVMPKYAYEQYGLVVSHFNAGSFLDYTHEGWKDFINVKDIAVIWGENLETDVYQHVKFWSGNFTWNAKAKREVWQRFNVNCIANNHILCNDKYMKKLLLNTRRGDQVYIKGYLADYKRNGTNFIRKSSTSRNDRGNKSCEVVYLTDYKIVKRGNPGWRTLFNISKYSMVILLIVILAGFFYG